MIPYGKRKSINGNYAAAIAAAMSCLKGGVIPGFPITPQTEIIEKLQQLSAEGIIKAAFIPIESEHSAMMACIGASPYARTFTATSSHGLQYMHEALYSASNLRLPIVMVNVSRGMGLPYHLWCDHNDIMAQRDQGWAIFFAETNQEIFDLVLMAFYLAEKNRIPIIVNSDGFISSHTAEPVVIPTQEQVDAFLPPYRPEIISSEEPRTFYPSFLRASLFFDHRQEFFEAMEALKAEIPLVFEKFEKIFGRKYGNSLVEYCGPQGAEIIIVSYASHFGIIREAINEFADNSIGALKIKALRPFPSEDIARNLWRAGKIIVIDRNISPGMGGVFSQEIKAVFQKYGLNTPVFEKIVGLGGENITIEMIKEVVTEAKENLFQKSAIWLRNKKDMSSKKEEEKLIETSITSLYLPTHTACAGCGAAAPLRHILEELGENTHLIIPACCHSITTGGDIGDREILEISAFGKKIRVKRGINTAVNTEHTLFAGAPATASGKAAALKQISREDIQVVCWCGDGSTYDIGFQALSAACEREESIIYVCYNNQAYMNTGVQRSGATPKGVYTNTSQTGKPQNPKNMMRIMAAHKVPYAATIILDARHIKDLKNKIQEAKKIVKEKRGLVYLELLAPCPPGWGCEPSVTEELSRLAFEAKIWPLYEVFDGAIYKIKRPKEISEEEQFLLIKQYSFSQGRFKNLTTDEELKNFQKAVNKNWEELLKQEWLSGRGIQDIEKK